MSHEHKHSTLSISEIEVAAAAAVKRAVEARQQAGLELSEEQVNSVSGGASYYLNDPFIYGIKIDPYWFKGYNTPVTQPALNTTIVANKTIQG